MTREEEIRDAVLRVLPGGAAGRMPAVLVHARVAGIIPGAEMTETVGALLWLAVHGQVIRWTRRRRMQERWYRCGPAPGTRAQGGPAVGQDGLF